MISIWKSEIKHVRGQIGDESGQTGKWKKEVVLMDIGDILFTLSIPCRYYRVHWYVYMPTHISIRGFSSNIAAAARGLGFRRCSRRRVTHRGRKLRAPRLGIGCLQKVHGAKRGFIISSIQYKSASMLIEGHKHMLKKQVKIGSAPHRRRIHSRDRCCRASLVCLGQ
jgi:hypothetical protein